MVEQKGHGFWDQSGLAPLHANCVMSGKLLNLTMPQFSRLHSVNSNNSYGKNFMWIRDSAICIKALGQCTAPSGSSVLDDDYFFNNI